MYSTVELNIPTIQRRLHCLSLRTATCILLTYVLNPDKYLLLTDSLSCNTRRVSLSKSCGAEAFNFIFFVSHQMRNSREIYWNMTVGAEYVGVITGCTWPIAFKLIVLSVQFVPLICSAWMHALLSSFMNLWLPKNHSHDREKEQDVRSNWLESGYVTWQDHFWSSCFCWLFLTRFHF